MGKIILALAVILCCSGCADMRSVQHVKHENELVMKIASGTKQVGLIGAASGRAVSESQREEAFNVLLVKHPEWHWDQIRRQSVVEGMTDSEVLLSLGQPYRVNRASYGDQWVYCLSHRCIQAKFVYFDLDGICTGWN